MIYFCWKRWEQFVLPGWWMLWWIRLWRLVWIFLRVFWLLKVRCWCWCSWLDAMLRALYVTCPWRSWSMFVKGGGLEETLRVSVKFWVMYARTGVALAAASGQTAKVHAIQDWIAIIVISSFVFLFRCLVSLFVRCYN